ncbi:MAG TPA: tetratricopeptide repeat protein [Myxococcota bacterium]|nr:tetratricopeptide repeat protein [Myxococcota bacterium]
MRRHALVFALAWAAACVAACGEPARPRAVVIGIDSADWRVIDPLVAEGRMPNLAKLRERGTSGPIQTLAELPISPVVWTSVATGKVPSKHGVTWFLVDQPNGTRVPVRSHNRKVKALWNMLAERGRTPIVLGWWATYPAEDVGPGIVVSDALGFHGFGRTARSDDAKGKTHPPELFAPMETLMPPEQQISPEFASRFMHLTADEYRRRRFDPANQAAADPTNRVQLFQEYVVTAQGYTAMAEQLLARPYDLFLTYYEQVDSLSHLFMKDAPPKLEWVDEKEYEEFHDVVREWYAYQDELLGRLLAKIDLDTTAVFVLSDHGFKSGDRRIRSEQAVDLRTAHLDHEPDGIFIAAGPHIRRGERVEGASVLDLAPTVLHYLDLPVAKDMDGSVLEAIFEPGFESQHAIAYVASYESGEPAAKPAVAADEPADDKQLAQNVAALETLGYVQKGAADSKDEPSSPEIHDNLGRTLANQGKLNEAEEEFHKALALAPNDADALLNLATVAALRGNPTQAEQLVKQALAANPDHTLALARLAELRRDAGDLPEATRLFHEALSIDEVNPDLYLGLGDVLQRAGQYKDAEAAFRRVLELDPDSFAAHYNLGVTALQQQQTDAAIASFQKALSLNGEHPLAAATWNNIGTAELDRGNRAAAMAAFEKSVALSPPVFEARFNLGSLYLEDGKLDDAIRLLEEGAKLSPNHEMLNERLARAYMLKGRAQDAYRTLTLLKRLYPRNWYASLGLATLYAANNHPEQAKPLLADALRFGGEAARKQASAYPALAKLVPTEPAGASH